MFKINSKIKKVIAVSAISMSLLFGTTAMAAEATIVPIQATVQTKANTIVYATADLQNPTACVLPENFVVNVTGATTTGFWVININGVNFYLTADAIKTGTTSATATTSAQPQAPVTVTLGMKNAVKKAKSYISFAGFSRQRLIEQLKYEGFSDAESVYGADNSGANWNTECAEKAQSYMSFASFSRQRLYEQLEYEGFLPSEIAYGLAAVGY